MDVLQPIKVAGMELELNISIEKRAHQVQKVRPALTKFVECRRLWAGTKIVQTQLLEVFVTDKQVETSPGAIRIL